MGERTKKVPMGDIEQAGRRSAAGPPDETPRQFAERLEQERSERLGLSKKVEPVKKSPDPEIKLDS